MGKPISMVFISCVDKRDSKIVPLWWDAVATGQYVPVRGLSQGKMGLGPKMVYVVPDYVMDIYSYPVANVGPAEYVLYHNMVHLFFELDNPALPRRPGVSLGGTPFVVVYVNHLGVVNLPEHVRDRRGFGIHVITTAGTLEFLRNECGKTNINQDLIDQAYKKEQQARVRLGLE